MTRASHHRSLLTLLLVSVTNYACPTPTSVAPQIETVEVEGSIGAIQFELVILGRAFGLDELWYNLEETRGEATTDDYRVRLFNTVDQTLATSSGADVRLVSPQEIRASVVLTTPLEPGVYGVEVSRRGMDRPLVSKRNAFEVTPGGGQDAGTPPNADGGVRRDAAPPTDTGTGPRDGGVGNPDARPPPSDAGFVDVGPADSGLGPWVAAYLHRRVITVDNNTAGTAPTGITLKVDVPHASMVRAGFARDDGRDLGIYVDGQRLDHGWDDATLVNTDQLSMVVFLPFEVPPGRYAGSPLVLYYDDPSADNPPTEDVFEFSERFDANPGGWFRNRWEVDCLDRVDGMSTGAICVLDGNSDPTRNTIGTPNLNNIETGLGGHLTYEVSLFIRGRMSDSGDVLYFSYSDASNALDTSRLIPDGQYDLFPPNQMTLFEETTGADREVRGWKLPDTPPMAWMRSRLRFVPDRDGPSLHLRYISPNGSIAPDTRVEVDDLQVRLALQPDFQVLLGRAETR